MEEQKIKGILDVFVFAFPRQIVYETGSTKWGHLHKPYINFYKLIFKLLESIALREISHVKESHSDEEEFFKQENNKKRHYRKIR